MPSFVLPAVELDDWPRDQPTIDAAGLVLRPLAPGDVEAVVAAYSDPDIQRWHVQTMTPDEAAAWIDQWRVRWARGTGASWAVTEAGAMVGRIGLRTLNLVAGDAEVAYWVLPEGRGRGIAGRALEALTAWSFADAGLHRIRLTHSTLNGPSCRVAVKAGYELEGTMRHEGLHADGWHDMHLHARLASD
jgi:ribosomal-protein-alanine N-acetyltransferase